MGEAALVSIPGSELLASSPVPNDAAEKYNQHV